MKKKMKLSDIIITSAFLDHVPSENKMRACRMNYERYEALDRYIVVTPWNVLIDGYCAYLVAKEKGIEEVIVVVSKVRKPKWDRKHKPEYATQMITYIYGIHPNDISKTEYVWRVPNSWTSWEYDILPGDMILVNTKNGIKPVKVTRIELLDKAPVEYRVRKVVKKL